MANNCPPSELIKEEAVVTAVHYSLQAPAHRAAFEFASGSVDNSNSTAGGAEAYRYSVLHVLVQATETRPLVLSQRLADHVHIMTYIHQNVHHLRVLFNRKAPPKYDKPTCATTRVVHTQTWKVTTAKSLYFSQQI